MRSGSTAYRLGAGDLGSRLVARLQVSRYGYRTQTVLSRPTALVRTTPTMRVATARSTQGVATYVTLRAAGVAHLGGLVKVTRHGHVLARLPVRNGVARGVVHGLPHGRSRIRVSYVQNSQVAGVSVTRRVLR